MAKEPECPIEYDASRKGYYYSDETFDLPVMKLTVDDLLSLLVIDRVLGSYRNSPFYERLHAIFDGLKRLLPDKVSIHTRELASNFSVIPDPVTEINNKIWLNVQEGIEKCRCLEIKDQAPGQKNAEILEPEELKQKAKKWFSETRDRYF